VDPWGSSQKVAEVFGTLNLELLGGWARTQTMDKAKRMGWRGHVQSDEGIRDAIERMVEMRMAPKLSAQKRSTVALFFVGMLKLFGVESHGLGLIFQLQRKAR
jgi:hypothetical protein